MQEGFCMTLMGLFCDNDSLLLITWLNYDESVIVYSPSCSHV